MILFNSEDVSIPVVLDESTKSWISQIVSNSNKRIGTVNYVFCSDEYILEVNKQYLSHNYYTDIITFDYCKGDIVSGDLLISLDTIQSNSQAFNTDYTSELHRVMIHGVLHLLGYKDGTESEKVEMRFQEDTALSLLSTFH